MVNPQNDLYSAKELFNLRVPEKIQKDLLKNHSKPSTIKYANGEVVPPDINPPKPHNALPGYIPVILTIVVIFIAIHLITQPAENEDEKKKYTSG